MPGCLEALKPFELKILNHLASLFVSFVMGTRRNREQLSFKHSFTCSSWVLFSGFWMVVRTFTCRCLSKSGICWFPRSQFISWQYVVLRHVRSGKWTWPPGNELCGRRFGTGLQSIEFFTSKRRSNMIEVCLLQKDCSCAFLCLCLCDLCSWNVSDGMEDYRHWRDWLAGCRDQQGAPFTIMGRGIGCFIMIAKAWV